MRYGILCGTIFASALLWSVAVAKESQLVDWTLYRKKEAVFQAVEDLVASQQSPRALAVTSESGREGNYSSTLTVVTVEPGGLQGDDSNKIRLLVDFGQHGREIIVVEVGVKLLQLLADDRLLSAFCGRHGIAAAPLLAALKHTIFKVVPMENIRGRERVEAGETCLRKNGRGVDINRNWGVHWGYKEGDYDPAEEYPGTAPFSEPEAGMMRSLAQSFKPHVWVNVHSGMEALFLPYDHRAEVPKGEGPRAALEILEELNVSSCGGRCAVGSGGKSVGYLAHGTATDYMFDELHIPLPFTWEIYGDVYATFSECYRMFNPTTPLAKEEVVDRWTAAFLRLVLLLPKHPAVAKASPQMLAAIQLAPIGSSEAAAKGKEPLQGKLTGKSEFMALPSADLPVKIGDSEGGLAAKFAATRTATEQLPPGRSSQRSALRTPHQSEMPAGTVSRWRYILVMVVASVFLFVLLKRRSRWQILRGIGLPRKRAAIAV